MPTCHVYSIFTAHHPLFEHELTDDWKKGSCQLQYDWLVSFSAIRNSIEMKLRLIRASEEKETDPPWMSVTSSGWTAHDRIRKS
jgi:hypothetical protein